MNHSTDWAVALFLQVWLPLPLGAQPLTSSALLPSTKVTAMLLCPRLTLCPPLQVTQKYSVVVVQGHLVSEALLLFGQQHFYVCENFTLSPVGDVYCTRHCLSR